MIVQELTASLDEAIKTVGETLFVDLAKVVTPLAGSVLTLYIIWLGYRVATGGAALRADDVSKLLVRIFIIFSIGLYWQNFVYIYELFSNAAADITYSFFASAEGAQGNTPAAGMDAFSDANKGAINDTVRAQGSITRGVLGAIMLFVLALLKTVYVFVVGVSKIATGICIAVAPLSFLCLLSERTKNFFETWLQSIIGYSMYPIAAAATVGTLTTMIGTVGKSDGASFDSVMIFLVLVLLAKATLLSVPLMAAGLTGNINLTSFNPNSLQGSLGGIAGKAGRAASNRAKQFASGARNDGRTVEQSRQTGTNQAKDAAEAGRKLRQKLSGRTSRKK